MMNHCLRVCIVALYSLAWQGVAGEEGENTGEESLTQAAPAGQSQVLKLPFFMMPTGQPVVVPEFAGSKVLMVVDTSTGKTTIHAGLVEKLGLTVKPQEKVTKVSGLEPVVVESVQRLDPLVVSTGKGLILLEELVVADLRGLQKVGDGAYVGGVLGSSFFKRTKARIDYAESALMLQVEVLDPARVDGLKLKE